MEKITEEDFLEAIESNLHCHYPHERRDAARACYELAKIMIEQELLHININQQDPKGQNNNEKPRVT